MERRTNRVLVAGGGLTGLSAAFYVNKRFAERHLPVDLTVVEQSGRFGGKIQTLRRDGFIIEKGPDSFLARKMPMIELARELGLEDRLTGQNPESKKSYIVRDGRLHRMPAGLVLGIPTQFEPFLESELISVSGKARALNDLLLPPRPADRGDESLGDFLERRLGREVLDHIAEPLLAGIYAGDTHSLSLAATFPQFREAELKYGSLIRGTVEGRQAAGGIGQPAGDGTGVVSAAGRASTSAVSPSAGGVPEVAKTSQFLTFEGGLESLVDALVQSLDGIRLQTGRRVAGIAPASRAGGYDVAFEDGATETYDAVIFALPTFAIAELLSALPAVRELGRIPYVSVANVIMAFRQADVEDELNGSGFLVPRAERRFITACTWTSRKWLHTAPPGHVLLRCYVGRSGDEDWQQLSDAQMAERVLRDLRELTGLVAEPLFSEVTRLPRSMPQYPVGHLERVQRARDELAAAMPGVAVTGAGFHGVGLPDCVRQGKEAAALVCDYLAQQNSMSR